MRDNEKLPQAIITPTSKALDGGHDEPLTRDEILSMPVVGRAMGHRLALCTGTVCARQGMAAERGLILVDTKYEFGTNKDDTIILADEIHTPDSSRYWLAASYEERFKAGERPQSFDKDFIRAWVTARCDPYTDPYPENPRRAHRADIAGLHPGL